MYFYNNYKLRTIKIKRNIFILGKFIYYKNTYFYNNYKLRTKNFFS